MYGANVIRRFFLWLGDVRTRSPSASDLRVLKVEHQIQIDCEMAWAHVHPNVRDSVHERKPLLARLRAYQARGSGAELTAGVKQACGLGVLKAGSVVRGVPDVNHIMQFFHCSRDFCEIAPLRITREILECAGIVEEHNVGHATWQSFLRSCQERIHKLCKEYVDVVGPLAELVLLPINETPTASDCRDDRRLEHAGERNGYHQGCGHSMNSFFTAHATWPRAP